MFGRFAIFRALSFWGILLLLLSPAPKSLFVANSLDQQSRRSVRWLCAGRWEPSCVRKLLSQQKAIEDQLLSLGFNESELGYDLGHFSLMILESARRFNIPWNVLVSVAIVESSLNPVALSTQGAMGIFQFQPATARYLWPKLLKEISSDDHLHRLDPVNHSYDVRVSTLLGGFYLRKLLDRFRGDWDLALGSYNVGPEKMRLALLEGEKLGQRYSRKVQTLAKNLRTTKSN